MSSFIEKDLFPLSTELRPDGSITIAGSSLKKLEKILDHRSIFMIVKRFVQIFKN